MRTFVMKSAACACPAALAASMFCCRRSRSALSTSPSPAIIVPSCRRPFTCSKLRRHDEAIRDFRKASVRIKPDGDLPAAGHSHLSSPAICKSVAFLSGADNSRRRRSAGALLTATVASTAATAACKYSCRRSSSASRPALAVLLNRSSPAHAGKAYTLWHGSPCSCLLVCPACELNCTQVLAVCSADLWPGSGAQRSHPSARVAAALPRTRPRPALFPKSTALFLNGFWAPHAPAQHTGPHTPHVNTWAC